MNEIDRILGRIQKHDQQLSKIAIAIDNNTDITKECKRELAEIRKHLFMGNGQPALITRVSLCEQQQQDIKTQLDDEIAQARQEGKWKFLSVLIVSITSFIGVILLYLSRDSDFLSFIHNWWPKG